MTVTDARRPLFGGLIDYAGLFPPARLDMPGAVAGYRAARHSGESFMVDRFVVPASRLGELAATLDAEPREGEAPWPLCILVDGAWPALSDGIAVATAGLARLGERGVPEVAEIRIPPPALGNAGLEEAVAAAVAAAATLPSRPFFEVPLTSSWPPAMRSAVAAIAAGGKGSSAGAKLRTGGLDAKLFPTPGRVADFILACTEAALPYKCTAGLHHPVRHDDPETGFTHHGFLNVLGASLLAWGGASHEELTAILGERDPAAFRISDAAFAWGNRTVGVEAIAAARRAGFVGYGSCSFDEPVAELRAMGAL